MNNDQNNNNESQLILKSKLDDMKDLVDGCGGLISINKNGEIANAFTTPRMCYAQLSSFGNDGKEYNGVCGVEINEKEILQYEFLEEIMYNTNRIIFYFGTTYDINIKKYEDKIILKNIYIFVYFINESYTRAFVSVFLKTKYL